MRRSTDRAIRAICERPPGRATVPTLVPMVGPILAQVGLGEDRARAVRNEVDARARCIARARRQIRAIGADAIARSYTPTACDELGAIAEHLEQATGTMLEVCEAIQSSLDPAPSAADDARPSIRARVTKIFATGHVSDLTGRRLATIGETVREIDVQTQALLAITHGRCGGGARRGATFTRVPARSGEAALLNGPALHAEGASQSHSDAMSSG